MLNAKGKEQLIEVLKGFQKDQIDAAVEQGAHLRAKALLPVDAVFIGVRRRTQWADAAGDEGSPCRLPRKLRRLPVYLIDAMFEAIAGQPNGIRPEGVGFNYARACSNVFSVNFADQLGSGQAEFLEALTLRHSALHQECSHGAVPADRVALDFLEQVHRHKT